MTDPVFVLAILCLNLVLTEWLVRKTFFRHFGTALMVILVTAVTVNLRVIPVSSPVYDGIFRYLAPLGIFWLLLRVNLRDVLRAGLPLLGLFLLGSVGTAVGAILGMTVVGGEERMGELFYAVGGMFTGTYTGGSANFNALAQEYELQKEGRLYVAAVAADNVLTTIWMAVTIGLPRLLDRLRPRAREGAPAASGSGEPMLGVEDDTERVHPVDLGVLAALGCLVLWFSGLASDWFGGFGWSVPSILILTTLALALAQVPQVARLAGSRLIGMFAVYLFLACIGALCDLSGVRAIGSLALWMVLYAAVVVGTHGLVTFGLAPFLGVDRDQAAVASQANIGGGTTALALARSLGRPDLVLPAVLIGSVGTAVGTYLGVLVAKLLSGWTV